jgi:hypothetical protein
MRRWFSAFLMTTLLFIAPLHGQETRHNSPDLLPPFIVTGMNAYKSVGPEAAVKAWVEDSALANSKDALDQAGYLHQTQELYGPFQNYALISTRVITPRTRVVYVVMEYEKGPLFAKFVVYRSAQRWLLTSLDLNVREEMILPLGTSQ